MATMSPDPRRRLLGVNGLHPRWADVIRAIDRMEADKSSAAHSPSGSYRDLLTARDNLLHWLAREDEGL